MFHVNDSAQFNIFTDGGGLRPYIYLNNAAQTYETDWLKNAQEGLGIKTYQSDMFNN